MPRQRDRNPLYAAADPPASGRCPTARGPSGAPAGRSLRLYQKHASRGAISIFDFQWRADKLVVAGLDASQIERLDDHDASAQQSVMDGISRFLRPLRFYGEVVDTDELYVVIDAPCGGARVERRKVPCERRPWIAPARAIARLEEHPLGARGNSRSVEPLAGDVLGSFVRDDPARSNERFEWQLVDGVPALDEVKWRVDVGPGVISER